MQKYSNHMKHVNWNVVKKLEKKALDIDPKKHFNPWKYCKNLEKKVSKLHSTRNCKYMLNYHIVWCPRGRVKILFHEARVLLQQYIEQLCEHYGWEAYAIEPMPDHIHLFMGTKDDRPRVLGILKGGSSAFLKKCFPIYEEALTDGKLWARSYYMGTIGNISGKTLLKYLAKQWKKTDRDRYALAIAAMEKGQKSLADFT